MFFKVHNYLFIVYTGILYCITMFGFADRVMYVYAIFCDAITFSLRKVYIKNFWWREKKLDVQIPATEEFLVFIITTKLDFNSLNHNNYGDMSFSLWTAIPLSYWLKLCSTAGGGIYVAIIA